MENPLQMCRSRLTLCTADMIVLNPFDCRSLGARSKSLWGMGRACCDVSDSWVEKQNERIGVETLHFRPHRGDVSKLPPSVLDAGGMKPSYCYCHEIRLVKQRVSHKWSSLHCFCVRRLHCGTHMILELRHLSSTKTFSLLS